MESLRTMGRDAVKETLYKKDASGAIRVWSCEIDYFSECLSIEHGVFNGEIQQKDEFIEEGKAGRTVEEQLELKFNSRVKKKKDSGYVSSVKQAATCPTRNALGLKRPMLAKKEKGNTHRIDWNTAMVQRKYNGHRCLVTKVDGKNIAYSRNGNLIKSIDHVLGSIDIEEGVILDGELYHHGTPLQTISSWVRRKQPASMSLKYMIYDTVMDAPFLDRLKALVRMEKEARLKSPSFLAGAYRVDSIDMSMKHFSMFREDGYEGMMLRHGSAPYQDGKRSFSLLKFKGWEDDEFMVVDIIPSKDDWAILTCRTEQGNTFRVSAPGTIRDKTIVRERPEDFIGRKVMVQYSEKTKDGTPFHPIAVMWRDKDEE